jgi:SAM-dependent methyltransferase
VYDGDNPGLEQLVPEEAECALDVGCGRGGMAARLARRSIVVDAASWNPEELKAVKSVCRRTICQDLNHGLPQIEGDVYDLIICSHLLEHIAFPQKFLKDLHRGLKAGGALLIAIPNLFFWQERLKLLCGRWTYEECGTFDYTHLRWYTRATLVQLLEQYGFRVRTFIADGWIPLPGLRLFISQRLRTRINRMVCRGMPGLFGQQLLFSFYKE